ncbi:MAG: hypothetical protein ACOX10_01435 [Candidatus Methanomethylophilaceae archaeon]|jgi:hypothetical protein|nr:hypothetical protein [Candidatus Thermoplasmatota archaeon]
MSLMSETEILMDATKVYAESAADLENGNRDPLPMSLWNIHNRVRMAVEMLSYYSGFRTTPETEGELTERTVVVTKDLFIDVVSAIEKASKDAVRLCPDSDVARKVGRDTRRINLRSILDASKESALLSEGDVGEWNDILLIRNLAVHNNAMADRPAVCRVGNISVSLRPGRMMKGPQETYVILTSRAVTLFYTWLRSLVIS